MQKISQNKELLEKLQSAGVDIIDPDSVFVEGNVEIGSGSIIYPQVFLTEAVIGENCSVGPVAQILNSIIGDNAYIGFTAQI